MAQKVYFQVDHIDIEYKNGVGICNKITPDFEFKSIFRGLKI